MIFLYSTGSGGLSVSTFREVQDTDISNNATGFAFISANRAWVVPHQSKKASPEPPARRSISSSPRRWCRCAQLGRPTVLVALTSTELQHLPRTRQPKLGPHFAHRRLGLSGFVTMTNHLSSRPQPKSESTARKHLVGVPWPTIDIRSLKTLVYIELCCSLRGMGTCLDVLPSQDCDVPSPFSTS